MSMAQYYTDLIISKNSVGPYILIGHSLGASVSFEMAGLLNLKGKSVPLLIVLDGPGCYKKQNTSPEEATQWAAELITQSNHQSPNTSESDDTHWKELINVIIAHTAFSYNPDDKKVDRILVIQAKDGNFNLDQWKYMSSISTKYYTVNGDHFSILKKPHINETSKIIKENIFTVLQKI